MFKRKLAVAYLFLVGLPLLSLIAILRAGQGLKAPASVGGTWILEWDRDALAAFPCRAEAGRQTALTISQSGRYLSVTANGSHPGAITGTIEGNDLEADAPQSDTRGGSGACGERTFLSLRARLEGSAGASAMTGLLAVDGCSNCAPIPFRAVRQASARKGVR